MLIPNVPIAKLDIKYDPNVQTLKPIFGGTSQRLSRGGERHSIDIETDSLLWSDAQRINTFIKKAFTEVAQVNIPTGDINTSGFGTVSAQSGSGKTLVLKGVTSGKTFKNGQYITIKYNKSGTIVSYLHQITADATAASNGVVTVAILPSLKRTSNLANSAVEVAQPYIEGFLDSDTHTITLNSYKLNTAKFTFTITEVE